MESDIMGIQNRKDYVTNLVETTLSTYRKNIKVSCEFKKRGTEIAASTHEYETDTPTIIFNIYWLQKLTYTELRNLALHECAHIITKNGHTRQFRETCCKIGVPKRWSRAYTHGVETVR
jgi:predicted metal-dependent hydrolase